MNNSDRRPVELLTEREHDVLGLVAIGMPYNDIAQNFGISPKTVKTHLHHIFKKIKVPNRLQAMLWAGQHL